MNASSLAVTEAIIHASQIYTLSVYFVILIGGIVGNICNIIVFTVLKVFQRNQCAFYLIVTSIADILLLILVLPLRVAEYVFDYDPTQLSLAWCKIRQAIVASCALMSFSTICFAAIDQYFSTHYKPWLRQLSSLKLAHRLVYTAIIVWLLYGIPFIIYFEIQSPFGCTIFNTGFQHFYSFVHYCMLNGIVPITSSGISAILAYFNVRHIVRRQVNVGRRRLDRQLTAIVLTKVAFLVVTTLPFVIYRIYISSRPLNSTDSVPTAVEELIATITTSLFYSNSAGTFYVFLSVSKRFRQQVKRALGKNIWKKLIFVVRINDTFHHHNQVVPASDAADLDPVD